MDEKERLLQLIAALEAQLADLKKRLPAHSIPPAMIIELDQIDEQLNTARQQLARLEKDED
jgi:hypothetical protein